MQTSTSDAPVSGPEAAGLPDAASLARLAGALFAALPGTAGGLPLGAVGGVPLPAEPLPAGVPLPPAARGPALPGALPAPGGGGIGEIVPGANLVPTSPQSAANLGASRPSLVPHAAAGNGLPDTVATAVPALDSRLGGPALGVPNASGSPSVPGRPSAFGVPGGPGVPGSQHGPVLPAVPPAQHASPPPATPYYFLDLAGGLPSPGAQALHGFDGVPPPVDGLAVANAPREAAVPSAPHGFYFIDLPGFDASRAAPAYGAVPNAAASAHPPFDVHAIRRDFPILAERINGRPLAWLDNAATTHKPQSVIDRLSHFYAHENSNIHRAAHALAARATDAYESARERVARFIGAASAEEIVFVRGCTEAINLVAKSWGAKHIGEGDEIIVSHLEHHANIVPWQQLCAEKGAVLRVIPVDDSGQVILSEYQRLLGPRTKLVAVTQVSNALGTVVPVHEIVELAHRHGACALVDGAQSVSHMAVDVRAMDADFFVFSGHKVFGPTGIGVVYGKRDVLEGMPPWQGGGNMIQDVTFERTVYHGPPARFEAGTGNIADAVGLGTALEYVQRIGLANIARYEHDLLDYATKAMRPIPGVRLIGTAQDKASVLSFTLQGYAPEEVGRALNEEGIAVRSGHHCAQPILRRFGVEATVRPSLAFYNTCDEVDRLVRVVRTLARH